MTLWHWMSATIHHKVMTTIVLLVFVIVVFSSGMVEAELGSSIVSDTKITEENPSPYWDMTKWLIPQVWEYTNHWWISFQIPIDFASPVVFDDYFEPINKENLPKSINFFVSYDLSKITENSYFAKKLSRQMMLAKWAHQLPGIYKVTRNLDKDMFQFPDLGGNHHQFEPTRRIGLPVHRSFPVWTLQTSHSRYLPNSYLKLECYFSLTVIPTWPFLSWTQVFIKSTGTSLPKKKGLEQVPSNAQKPFKK